MRRRGSVAAGERGEGEGLLPPVLCGGVDDALPGAAAGGGEMLKLPCREERRYPPPATQRHASPCRRAARARVHCTRVVLGHAQAQPRRLRYSLRDLGQGGAEALQCLSSRKSSARSRPVIPGAPWSRAKPCRRDGRDAGQDFTITARRPGVSSRKCIDTSTEDDKALRHLESHLEAHPVQDHLIRLFRACSTRNWVTPETKRRVACQPIAAFRKSPL